MYLLSYLCINICIYFLYLFINLFVKLKAVDNNINCRFLCKLKKFLNYICKFTNEFLSKIKY